MSVTHARIRDVAVHLPEERQKHEELHALLTRAAAGIPVPADPLRRLYGIESRAVAPATAYPSDLASTAAAQALARSGWEAGDLDLIIYAAVTADLDEPATAHVVADKLGARCPAFDVRNACNAVLNALEVADALIRQGTYRKILIATGEVLSRYTRRRIHSRADLTVALATFTGGDIGTALLVEASHRPGIAASRFAAASHGWRAAMVPNAFGQGESNGELAEATVSSAGLVSAIETGPIQETAALFDELGMDPGATDLACVHQPSINLLHYLCDQFRIPYDKTLPTVTHVGNVGSGTIPLQLAVAREHGRLHEGDRVVLIGAASGVSVGVMVLTW
ncbi:hypothetical protein OG897_31675 [Streptomyces sp. NBC_00237]|uniref:3-oxoacyl-ACP synthase III family protein n=1 Tax=Streptomyces sp. NBC_00237 TaxID=2975687 RepID=UPI0022533257|nr:3-oxoacyl-[acyl-carrier-protein] synthase III C-terminal domain-containing protein [Streptomyces sp. NBC_00237]MCX5205967.1 hypothetical protein [Streptomyces sp. NBC_00237]